MSNWVRIFEAGLSLCLRMESRRCSGLISSLFSILASKKVTLSTFSACLFSGRVPTFSWAPDAGIFWTESSSTCLSSPESTSRDSSTLTARLSFSATIPSMRCSVPMKSWPRRTASSRLRAMTCLTLGENRLLFIRVPWLNVVGGVHQSITIIKEFRLLYKHFFSTSSFFTGQHPVTECFGMPPAGYTTHPFKKRTKLNGLGQ